MARFYFDVDDEGELFVDHVGEDLIDTNAARQRAKQSLMDIARDEIPRDGSHRQMSITVRGEDGIVITQVRLDFEEDET